MKKSNKENNQLPYDTRVRVAREDSLFLLYRYTAKYIYEMRRLNE